MYSTRADALQHKRLLAPNRHSESPVHTRVGLSVLYRAVVRPKHGTGALFDGLVSGALCLVMVEVMVNSITGTPTNK